MVAAAAHEVGNPLTPIRMQLDLLRKGGLSERQAQQAEVIDRNVDQLVRLVEDFLEVARLEADPTLDLRPVDLRQALDETAGSFAGLARERGVSLEVRVPHGLRAEADPRRVMQVLYNLVSNALKATSAGGRVSLEAEAAPGEATVTVRDTGKGLKAEDLPKLFQPFTRLQPTNGTRGSGLGLYAARSIVELHGGRIWAESDGPGRGAVFRFTLPARASAPI